MKQDRMKQGRQMIKSAIMCIALMFFMSVQTVYSADEKGRYWIYGVGQHTCETFKESRSRGGAVEGLYQNWISGYLTSSNRSTKDTYNLLGKSAFQDALTWLDQYCIKYPQNTLYMAMANLTAVYYPQRTKSR